LNRLSTNRTADGPCCRRKRLGPLKSISDSTAGLSKRCSSQRGSRDGTPSLLPEFRDPGRTTGVEPLDGPRSALLDSSPLRNCAKGFRRRTGHPRRRPVRRDTTADSFSGGSETLERAAFHRLSRIRDFLALKTGHSRDGPQSSIRGSRDGGFRGPTPSPSRLRVIPPAPAPVQRASTVQERSGCSSCGERNGFVKQPVIEKSGVRVKGQRPDPLEETGSPVFGALK
jgi:hypothetical protein